MVYQNLQHVYQNLQHLLIWDKQHIPYILTDLIAKLPGEYPLGGATQPLEPSPLFIPSICMQSPRLRRLGKYKPILKHQIMRTKQLNYA